MEREQPPVKFLPAIFGWVSVAHIVRITSITADKIPETDRYRWVVELVTGSKDQIQASIGELRDVLGPLGTPVFLSE